MSMERPEEVRIAINKKLDVISSQADQIRELVDKLCERVEEDELATNNGISFLEVKHHTMFSYISSISYLSLLKLHGKSIENHPAISQLIEDRTVLEKMKPLEQRLKYQIDKLLRSAVVASDKASMAAATNRPAPHMITTDDPEAEPVAADDSAKLAAAMLDDDSLANPTAFKPNPASLASDIRGDDEELSKEDGIYRAPKQVPVHYEEDGSLASKREKAEKRMLERASRSRLVRDLMSQYDDRPETASASGNPDRALVDSRMEHLAEKTARYEEENFRRVTMKKKERKGMRTRLVELEDEFSHLNDFAGIASLQKASAGAGSKAAILDRLKQKRDNESPAEKAQRRRRGRAMGSDDDMDFSAKRMRGNKKGGFNRAKRFAKLKR
ncbi:hypothetical protein J3B02_004941 [Coemansia erecta]|uniref:Neuroguidin n=1 Tax=Coemansia asiatica TaxID=1052880 RepID=A0A9W7XL10_9FUNG|nr:hypothetical protein LPJ64_003041 [Coemansia asiatica]KAJ2844519.1 hypothetical protein J3B02_004941 [Coemansia erecta]KAJ2889104.1 hypothetical protein FB639_000156 [Coemansia asiatica]